VLSSALDAGSQTAPHVFSGLHGSSASLLLASWFATNRRTALAVAPSRAAALRLADDLEAWLCEDDVVYLPQQEVMAFDRNSPDPELVGATLVGLERLADDRPCLAVTSLAGMRHRLITPAKLASAKISLQIDQRIDRVQLGEQLQSFGYQAVGTVARVGDFAVRGSLIDVHPPGSAPVRIEFFDDEILTLRTFGAGDQRTTGKLDRLDILPVTHLILDDDGVMEALVRLEQAEADGLISGDDHIDLEARFEERMHGGGLEAFLPLYGETALISDHLAPGAPVIWFDPAGLVEQSKLLDEEIPRMRETRSHQDPWLPPVSDLIAPATELDWPDRPSVWLTGNWIGGENDACWLGHTPAKTVPFDTHRPGVKGGDVAALGARLSAYESEGHKTAILCDNQGQANRLGDLLMEQDGPVPASLPVVGRLSEGFIWPEAKLAIITDHEFFERYHRPTKSRFRGEAVVKDSGNLQPGEHVVHVEYGIGRYQGLRRITVEGTDRECLLIDFASNDKVYVPVENIDLVERYSSDKSAAPELSRLGTASWARVTKKARKAIQAMAVELLELYAAREIRPGFEFPPDGDLMKSLEESFIHQETPDQLTAIEDVKVDMEKPQPMDRLVCGDVGYGKTEVAMRATFKAVEAGKQVAILCPTTLLAHQHNETFGERFRDFPASVEVLSRFRSVAESKETIRRAQSGELDVLIGTHRLLSRDVKFKNLGLLVIDEEHRFGVRHKERMKQLRKEVDVVTLSATPIPRTLYLSLMGARDMSLINTPPRDRLPIQTEIVTYNEDVLREAILRELHRGGQIFFVHNRVQTIQGMAATITKLLPNVRVAVAHGQMKENELEKIMRSFLNHEADVLVTTTIIESGLDMPRVNTIIIDRADRFGLAQLYQIRGRVGRSNQRAFAYLMTPPGETLTPDARRRLSALQEFQALGSGYHIAMRDLEIRGAGNILGQKQHGHLEAIGFDLYCRLLDEAVRDIKGGGESLVMDVKVDLRVPAYLPDSYIADPETKMDLYRRLARVREVRAFAWLRDEIHDRFGPLPEPTANLLDISRIRLLAAHNGIEEVRAGRKGLSLFFAGGREPSAAIIRGLMGTGPKGLQFKAVEQFVIQIPASRDQLGAAAFTVLDLLDRLRTELETAGNGPAGTTNVTRKETT
jgi:transcription-repair coupling factor (superfamily II helicase)